MAPSYELMLDPLGWRMHGEPAQCSVVVECRDSHNSVQHDARNCLHARCRCMRPCMYACMLRLWVCTSEFSPCKRQQAAPQAKRGWYGQPDRPFVIPGMNSCSTACAESCLFLCSKQ